MKKLVHKKLATAFCYMIQTPLGVWCGFALATNDYLISGVIVGVMMCLEFIAIMLWFDAQTEELVQREKIEEGVKK